MRPSANVGRYLDELTPTQEDRVLTQRMGPWPTSAAPCLIQTARGDCIAAWMVCRITEVDERSYRRQEFHHRNNHRNNVGAQYDALCKRFGTYRTNKLIRARILRNRLRRTLARPSPVVAEIGV